MYRVNRVSVTYYGGRYYINVVRTVRYLRKSPVMRDTYITRNNRVVKTMRAVTAR